MVLTWVELVAFHYERPLKVISALFRFSIFPNLHEELSVLSLLQTPQLDPLTHLLILLHLPHQTLLPLILFLDHTPGHNHCYLRLEIELFVLLFTYSAAPLFPHMSWSQYHIPLLAFVSQVFCS